MTGAERPLEDGWLPDTPVGDTVLRQFVHNQGQLNEVVAHAFGGRAVQTDDAFLADTAGPVPYFNQAVLRRPLRGDEDPVLGEVEAFYAGRQAPATLLSIWPTPALAARGWSLMGHPALVARPAGPHDAGDRAGVAVRVAVSPEDVAEAERIVVEGYPLPEAAGDVGAGLPPALLDTDVTIRLGEVDGTPVAVGNSYVAHGVVNLCLAATLPAARRRGVWAALVWARVDDGPGLPAVAYTSDYSRPGFIRMGFLPVIRCTLWAR